MSLVAGLVVFCCVFNALFLEKYYIRQQQKALIQAFDSVKEVINGAMIAIYTWFDVLFPALESKYIIAAIDKTNIAVSS